LIDRGRGEQLSGDTSPLVNLALLETLNLSKCGQLSGGSKH
jgi:hypothetical protein